MDNFVHWLFSADNFWIMPRAMLLQTPGQLQAEVAARTADLAATGGGELTDQRRQIHQSRR